MQWEKIDSETKLINPNRQSIEGIDETATTCTICYIPYDEGQHMKIKLHEIDNMAHIACKQCTKGIVAKSVENGKDTMCCPHCNKEIAISSLNI